MFVAAAASPAYPEGRIMNSEEMLFVWLNAFWWHKDKEKNELFDSMHGITPPEATIANFVFLLSDMASAILGLRQVIALLKGVERPAQPAQILSLPLKTKLRVRPAALQVAE